MLLGIQSFMLIHHIYIETYNCRIIEFRIIEWLGLEGILNIIQLHPFTFLSRAATHQISLPSAPSNLTLNLELWYTHSFSGQLVLMPHFPRGKFLHSKSFIRISNLNVPSFTLKLFLLVLSLADHLKSPSQTFLQGPSRYWKATIRSPRAFSSPG